LLRLASSRAFHKVVTMPDLANHVHGDHLESLLKVSADQWNTLVNFELALCCLAGQFCIGANTLPFIGRKWMHSSKQPNALLWT